MSVVERSRQLLGRIQNYERFKESTSKADKFREYAQILSPLREQLEANRLRVEALLHHQATLSRAELQPIEKLPKPAPVLESLAVVRTKLTTNPESLKEGREFTTFKKRFERFAIEAGDIVRDVIDAVKKGIPSVDKAFLEQVAGIPAYRDKVDEIRAMRAELDGGDVATAGAALLDAFLTRRAALRKLTDELNPVEFPKPVLDFFRAARRKQGADLDDLTDEVKTWLKEHGLLDRLRLFFTG